MSGDRLRWRLADEERDGQTALFAVDGLTGPERGTGRLSGLEFLHVTAKRILNEVPPQSQMPFRWTINVYRGCSHSCTYCLGGETPILMADGRTKRLAEVRAGDRVYGTERRGQDRRYVATEVLDHWQTVKPAYRVTLEDGTELLASGDHRFLTDRGWKHVAAAGDDRPRRAHLTAKSQLLGVGALPPAPAHGVDYRRGYLTGIIRCSADRARDGHPAERRAPHRFPLSLADGEALERARTFLRAVGVSAMTFTLAASDTRRANPPVRTTASKPANRIRAIIEWPRRPSDQWRLGFLAGAFDVAGCLDGGELGIRSSDTAVVERVVECAVALGFHAVLRPAAAAAARTVWIGDGLRERLRFLALADPATTRKRTIDGARITGDAALRVTSVVPVGAEIPMYDLTTGTGDFIADGVVSHNCFARPTHEYLGLNIGEDFDRKIVVKINAVEKLRAELASTTWRGEAVAMGTNTDPYQRCEGKYRLTRGVLEVLAEHGNPFSILTKSALVLRDLDVLTAAAQRADVTVNFSIGTLDERVWRATEPGTPHPRRRLDALRQMSAAGIRTGALVAPVLPGLSDDPALLREVSDAIRDAGGRVLGVVPLHLRPGVREHFLDWLAGFDPGLHADYLRRYARGAYAPRHYTERLRESIR